jgi:hypothetical protein
MGTGEFRPKARIAGSTGTIKKKNSCENDIASPKSGVAPSELIF